MTALDDVRPPAAPARRGDARGRASDLLTGPLRALLALLLRTALTLLGLLTLLFFLVRLKGDPAGVLAGPSATPEQLDEIRAAYGLDRSLLAQYLDFLGDTARLDFGTSVFSGQPALEAALAALPATLVLIFATMVLSVLLGIPAGMALHRGPRPVRVVLSGLLTLGQAVPAFVIGVGLSAVLAVRLGWLPAFGSGTAATLVMPTVTLALFAIARTARMVDAELDLVEQHDFLRTAAAKGASERRVAWRHALPNAFPAVAAALVVETSYLISGAVVVEVLFAYDGIGKRLVDAIFARDYPVVQASVFAIGVVVIVINVIGDALLRALDPRTGRAAA
ncbi:ABC transporter permease [Nocardioides sp. zg-536]|uniref:ABC transporter permease n=1 Tax=Nocardioides faecalis TaxID=2803858 RepID=A0A938Y7R8_9ACTN|nr:ABC transporter permease [Nocardioides faecalis]MBM9459051.1 ABC transporter permease [Nocardioides faecalis]QVI57316.1 ABC transporter permease [Nocardioides faecalis]